MIRGERLRRKSRWGKPESDDPDWGRVLLVEPIARPLHPALRADLSPKRRGKKGEPWGLQGGEGEIGIMPLPEGPRVAFAAWGPDF
jgi:hypothetical protein